MRLLIFIWEFFMGTHPTNNSQKISQNPVVAGFAVQFYKLTVRVSRTVQKPSLTPTNNLINPPHFRHY
ncbi:MULTISPECIES: hypothetical protein [unclassified Microcoleus]|uniref:hypothetical protein n=1 Tax=unclassified Microcoleus TaxID=2642155 RepID=UPI001D2E30BC|nr:MULTISPECIES: hypothetical protein [unclassified Microcoleus]MCC3569813.1 hypothetical protein [Microcoleus sp. PH2017_31_RDM_U_A]MCC3415885.1 hypothetical protein [Microcoleus sp. PH2017_02_FOX_O_A]MCC3520003.1 hypothetical protein [Microcoleus sp. PH2017_18_LLB_O_A]MCC3582129.1 hypothetical protein [Microcoleus sp. PH2017_32_RDM_D_A]MCC3620008.1 hypothetical protein [Microcoleus sp. PH2017_38_RDM_U_B]